MQNIWFVLDYLVLGVSHMFIVFYLLFQLVDAILDRITELVEELESMVKVFITSVF